MPAQENVALTTFSEATANAIPSLLAYDPTLRGYVIGDQAKHLARSASPVIQDFKRYAGEDDDRFEGRYKASRLSLRPERLWLVRPDLPEKANRIATKQVLRLFLENLFTKTGKLPEQLIVGVPAINDGKWQSNYRRHVRQVLGELAYGEPLFFPEPFAVFQYYRHWENVIPKSNQPLTVLIVDFGGGTFDCCIVETTADGNLARGGATSIPLGVQSVEGAGKELDRKLMELGIGKVSDARLKQEPIESRLSSRPWILLFAEEIKISLSQQMQGCRLEEDCNQFLATSRIPAGFYHPEVQFDLALTGEDLKKAINELWFKSWGRAILKTLDEVKYGRRGVQLEHLDRVILAGGSSALPFLTQLVAKTLAGQVAFKAKDIVVGAHLEKAVAYGLAFEAREQRKRSLRTHHSIGPCVFNRLFLYAARRRSEVFERPYISRVEKTKQIHCEPGVLLDGPMRIGEFASEYTIKLPFLPKESLFFWFCDKEDSSNPEADRLNLRQDVLRLPTKTHKSFTLRLEFSEDGLVKPIFTFDGKRLEASPFLFPNLRLAKEVESFAGIDLGTSNTYVVNVWSERHLQESKYPTFTITDSTGQRLREVESKIQALKSRPEWQPGANLQLARSKEADFIFHSIKIEGSALTRGETEDVLAGRRTASTKEMIEPVNVRSAYEFVLESANSVTTAPGAFIREINRIVLKGLDERGGNLRTGPVKIAGMDYEPPAAVDVPAFMEALSNELKEGPKGKSVIHFAAEMHSKLAAIHPFVDGNGRTARLLMNAILVDSGLPPAIINFQDKQRYLDGLMASNRGDLSPIVEQLAEIIEAALEEPEAAQKRAEPVAEIPKTHAQVQAEAPSHRLAEVMRKKIANLPIDREARYKAWLAAFGSFREQVQVCCLAFNEAYSHTPYRALQRPYDILPFEKYDSLLRDIRTPRTWFSGVDIQSAEKSERFIFFFQTMSGKFKIALSRSHIGKTLPPTDVTLSLSRWSDGSFHRLSDEPVKLREVGYFNGELIFLQEPRMGLLEIKAGPTTDLLNEFLADSIDAFL